jgi:hypothetical protein
MANLIGLYYPFTEFQDDAWIKFAALYWDKLGRIVPQGYQPHDSQTVQRLIGELDFIQNFRPLDEEQQSVNAKFYYLIYHYPFELKKFYGAFVGHVIGDAAIPKESLLAATLASKGLALTTARLDHDQDIIGVHPKFFHIYMEVLATEMASARQLRLVSDNELDYLASSGYTFERLVQALLRPDDPQPHLLEASPGAEEIEMQLATIALQSVLPQNLASVPTEKIIKLRKQHRDEMTVFQTYIHDFVTGLETLQEINDPVALKAHLEVEYEKKLKPQLSDFKRCLQSLGIDTVMGALNIRAALPPLLTSAGEYLTQAHLTPINPVIVGAGAVAFSVFPIIQMKQQEARQIVRSSPVAYLLYAQENLTPANLVSQVTQRARQMLFRV